MKDIKMKFLLMTILTSLAAISMAKEVELILKMKTQYPMKAHYKFLNDKNKNLYGDGDINLIANSEPQHIYVNRIPDKDAVLIQIDKMIVGNRTEINDPCEIKLDKDNLKAEITIGFNGNPKTHGSFTCSVSKS